MIRSSAAIAIAGDRNFYPRIATLMCMLKSVGEVVGRYPVFIFTDDASFHAAGGLLDDSLEKMGIVEGRDYAYQIVTEEDLAQLPDRYPGISAYLRLWLPNALSGYSRCLYLDGDVLIRSSLRPLIEMDMENNILLGTDEPTGQDCARRLGLKRSCVFNSGVLLIDVRKWIEADVSGKSIGWLLENRDRVVWADQDALNAVLDMDAGELPARWNMLRNMPPDAWKNPVIVHFNSAAKPWNFGMKHPYRKAYRHWLKRTPWPHALMGNDDLRHRLRETKLHDIWERARRRRPEKRI